MYKSNKLFPVTQVGSWPRSRLLLKALRDKQKGRISQSEFDEIANSEAKRCIEYQLQAGVDILVEGEHHRDNFYSFLTDKLEGTRLMSLAEMLDNLKTRKALKKCSTRSMFQPLQSRIRPALENFPEKNP